VKRRTILSLAACIAFAGLAPAAFAQEADLAASKSSPSSALAGTDVSFDVTVFNFGADDAVAASLSDPLPAGMTFVSENQNSGPAFSCSTPSVGTNGTITCTLALFTAGSSADFTFIGHIPPATPLGTTFTNTATISSGTFDPNSENNSSSAAVTVPIPQADIGVQKTGPSTAAANSDVAYSITVNNSGPDPALSFSLTDTLPGTMTFVSIAQNSGAAFDCTSHPSVGSGGTITCTITSFAAGATATFTLTGHIPAGTASSTTYTNTANISSTTTDLNPDNNSSLTFLTVVTSDLAITKTGPATATSGGSISWTITASNNGPDISQPTTFDDPLPAGTTFVSIVQNTGPTFVCGDPGVGNNGNVSCSIGTIGNFASGASAQFTLTANINPSFVGSLSNTATISGPNADTNPGNNSATAVTNVTASADLAVNKTGPATANAGTDIIYTVTLTNNGPSNAASVALNDAVPANTTFVSESQTTGATFSCTTPSVGGTGTVNCTIASFAPGSATFSITVHISPGAVGAVISNTANATTSTTDSTPGNNTSTVLTNATGSADVSIVKTAAAAASTGSNLTYNVNVTNNGPSDAASVTMTDTLPPNTTFVSESQPTGPAFICVNPLSGGTGTVSCSIATLTAGTSATFSIVVQIAVAAPVGPSSNTATVTTSSPDPNPANNSSTAVTTIALATADLSITKTPASGPYGTGLPLTYTIVVTNGGPSTATAVTVTDILPPGTTFQSATPGGACSGTTTITCNAGTLTNGASASFTLTVTLPSSPGPITNTASVTAAATTADPNPSNNSASSTITVIPAGNIPLVSPLALLFLGVVLAAAGAIALKR
jgi:conserved repeat domain